MKLQLTNGYHPHLEQIARLLQFLLKQGARGKIPRVEVAVATGLAENQVESLTSVAVAYGLIVAHSGVLTTLGRMLADYDPYFDRIESLWLIHYIISSNPEWLVWHRVVNNAFQDKEVMTAAGLLIPYFSDFQGQYSARTLEEKLPKEVQSVLWTYAQSGLSRLGLLRQDERGIYLRGVCAEVPPLAFLCCLVHYRSEHAPTSTALPIAEVASGQDSPGAVLNLPEYQVRTFIERLQEDRLVGVERFGDLDQVRFPQELTLSLALQRIYGS